MPAHPTPPPKRARRPVDPWLLALGAAMAIWSLVFTTLAFRLHTGMRTHRSDLGQVAQAVWNSSRGRLLEQTDNGFLSTRLTDHVEPILALVSPVLWVWPDVRALLLLQVVAVAAGAWFVYDLALLRLGRVLSPVQWGHVWRRAPLLDVARPLALSLGVAWLLAPQLHSAVLTELHAVPFAAPLILWALWAVEVRRWGHFGVAALLVAAVKEETALLAALLGLWAIWRAWGEIRFDARNGAPTAAGAAGVAGAAQARRFGRAPEPGLWWGAAAALTSLGWFAVATFVIVPRHAAQLYGLAESGYFARYGALGDSPLEMVRSLFTQPGLVWSLLGEPARLRYLAGLVAPFALLPLLGPELLLLALPVLAANVLSAYPAQFFGEFHYSAPVMPFVAAAAAFGLGRLWSVIWRRTEGASPAFQHLPAAGAGSMALAAAARNPAAALRPMAAGLLLLWVAGWSIGAYVHFGRGPGGGRFDPTPITEHHRLLPELVARIPADAPVTATAAVHPHLAMRRFIYQFPLGLEPPAGSEAATWALLDVTTNTDMAPGDLRTRVLEMLAGDWAVVDGRDGYLLLRRGEGDAAIPTQFYTFTQPEADGQTPPRALDWPRWRQTRIVAEWPAGDSRPSLTLLTPAGETIYTLDSATPPALLWREWAEETRALTPGQALRAETPWLWLPRSVFAHTGEPQAGTVFRRTRNDALHAQPYAALEQDDYAQAVEAFTAFRLTAAHAAAGADAPLSVTLWREERTTWPGDTIDLWLQWQGSRWPGDAPRLQLLHSGQVVAESAGPPALFGRDQSHGLAAQGFANDWRTLTLPADATPDGNWTIALLLGDRALLTLPLRVARHIPDQVCALVGGAACASQPE